MNKEGKSLSESLEGADNNAEQTGVAEKTIVDAKTSAKPKALSLVAQLKANQAEYVAPEEETLSVTIKDIKNTKDEQRVMMITDIGNIFAWRNVFDGGVPIGAPAFKAEITLRGASTEKGDFVNISRVKYNLEATGKYSFVATHKLAVSL